ncbi:MAG: hypothetical protein WD069_06590 [Planctomycetales bacterium]
MIKRRKLRLYPFRVDGPGGRAAGYCQTYFMSADEMHAAAEFFVVRSTFADRGAVDPAGSTSTLQLALRVFHQAHLEMPGRSDEPAWIADRLREAFGDAEVTVDEVDFS